MSRKVLGPLSLALGVALLWACDDKKPPPDSPQADASAGKDKYATADPKLARALQAAASASASSENGPPPDGIFPAGAGNKRHATGVPTKVDVLSEGSEPRVSLDPGPSATPASSYGPAGLRLGLQMGQRIIDLALALGPGKKNEGGPDWLVADIKKASPPREQLGQLPPGEDKEIGSLQGTQVLVKVTPDGRVSDVQVMLGKGTRPDLDRVAQSAAEALVFAMVPLPSKPVGVGGQWIAETRMPLAGVDAIAYRAYTVKSIGGNRVHLTLDMKAYATSTDVQLQGLPKGAALEQFVGEGQGEMELMRGEALARMFDMQQRIVMRLSTGAGPAAPSEPGQPPGNTLTAQVQGQATFVRGEDLRAATKP